MNEMKQWVEKHYHKCESPIERAFLLALIERSSSMPVAVGMNLGFELDSRLYSPDSYGQIPIRQPYELWHRDLMFIWSQAPINNYRADFVIGLLAYDVFKIDGEYKEFLVRKPLVVIECDGHDFHERTKEQAKRDKSRDRYMQSIGFRVLRFTGSEIHADALRCAHEAAEFIYSLSETGAIR
jgi:very-short-patch-repair endonuclease